MSDQLFEILVVRHGRSLGQDDVTTYKSIGDSSIPLTQKGKEQAEAAGEFLNDYFTKNQFNLTRVFTSKCQRASDTASFIVQNISSIGFLPIHPDERLDKQKFGIFDGMLTDKERQAAHPKDFITFQKQVDENGLIHARPVGGESIADVYERTASFTSNVADIGSCNVAVTHGLPGFCIEKNLLGLSDEWLMSSMDTMKNCQITRISVSPSGAQAEILCDDPLEWKKQADNFALRA